jgi:hypothetical protein
MGRYDDCGAKARNKAEREWLEKAQAEFDAQEGRWDPYRLMILRIVEEPEPEVSIQEARRELGTFR